MIGISLPTNPEARYDMVVKRQAIGRFMFNMAFENSIEDGYVTEKPFDALISGTTSPDAYLCVIDLHFLQYMTLQHPKHRAPDSL